MLVNEIGGKALLREFGVAVPPGIECQDLDDLTRYDGGFPAVVKAQVPTGGRGKAGGVRRCDDLASLEEAFVAVMNLQFAGIQPSSCLVEPWLAIQRETYLAVTVDGAADGFVVLYGP